MRNGLYHVQFQTPLGSGDGVVFAHDGKIWGGDSLIYYRGSYALDGDSFTATVETDAHSHQPGMGSVFGVNKATIRLTGNVSGDTVATRGSSPQAPGISFSARLNRLSD